MHNLFLARHFIPHGSGSHKQRTTKPERASNARMTVTTLKPLLIHAKCGTCGAAVRADAYRDENFVCRKNHVTEYIDCISAKEYKSIDGRRVMNGLGKLPKREKTPQTVTILGIRAYHFVQDCGGQVKAIAEAQKKIREAGNDAGKVDYWNRIIAEIK